MKKTMMDKEKIEKLIPHDVPKGLPANPTIDELYDPPTNDDEESEYDVVSKSEYNDLKKAYDELKEENEGLVEYIHNCNEYEDG